MKNFNLICLICKKSFYQPKCRILKGAKFCSNKCRYKSLEGKLGWNKGLTKENDIRVAKIANKLKGRPMSQKTIEALRKANTGRVPWNKGLKGFSAGPNSPSWKGGRQKSGNGYIYIYMPEHPFADKRNRIYEHRVIMEKKLGRYLTAEEKIDHINEITNDNRIENLQIVTHGENLKLSIQRKKERLRIE